MKFIPEALVMRRARYRTLAVELMVNFAIQEQVVETLEGPVACKPGDAIVTGTQGERWPIPAGEFETRYEPSGGQATGVPGTYRKRIKNVEAAQLHAPLDVELTEGRGTLHGEAGDWCVWHGDRDVAIVGKEIFPKTYELTAIPVYVGLKKDLVRKDDVKSAIERLQHLLPNTPLACIDETVDFSGVSPVWFYVVEEKSREWRSLAEKLEVTIDALLDEKRLVSWIKREKDSGAWAYTRRLVLNFFPFFRRKSEEEPEQVVAKQLAALEVFNSRLETTEAEYPLISGPANLIEPPGLSRIHRVGTVADKLAGSNQESWQGLVYATTKEIAGSSGGLLVGALKPFWESFRPTLVTLGILAALSLAAYSELSAGCEPDDRLACLGCSSAAWKHWFGVISFSLYLGFLGGAWARYSKSKAEKWEARHQDCRLLAECVRVIYVRAILGQSKWVVGDLPKSESTESDWVKLAIGSMFYAQPLGQLANAASDSDQAVALEQAKACFIEHQVTYHQDTLLGRREKAIEHLSADAQWGLTLFMSILLVQFVNVILEVFFSYKLIEPMVDHFLMIALVLGLASWGAMRNVIDTFGLEQEVQRGKLVLDSLMMAQEASTTEAVLQAASEFLRDQAGWHALQRSRPVEAATGA